MPGSEQDRLLLILASGVFAQAFLVRFLPHWLAGPLKKSWRVWKA